VLWTSSVTTPVALADVPNGGSASGYQAIFVPSTTLVGPGYDGQPAVYLYITALEVNVRNCRVSDVNLHVA
jgi:hypothetical protein